MEFCKPPNPLFDCPSPAESWPRWKQRFEIYLIASGKKEKSEEIKIATLLSCIGEDGLDIYNTFDDDQKSTYEKLIQAFDNYFLPKKVVAMESFKFHTLTQDENQTIDQYVTELKNQAKVCDFVCENETCKQSYENRMIRDRLIVGIFCKESQLRLLREPKLDTKNIVDYCKSIELSKEHLKVLNPTEVHAVREHIKKIKCPKCLYEHFPNRCPAFNRTCAICQVKGHFAKACPEKKYQEDSSAANNQRKQEEKPLTLCRKEEKIVRLIDQQNEEDEEQLFVNECYSNNLKGGWFETINVGGKNINFKLDTGSDISIISKLIFDSLIVKPEIKKSVVTLVTYGNFKVKPIGEVFLQCSFKHTCCKIKFIVVDFSSEALLGLDDCIKFKLINRVYTLETSLPKSREEIFSMYYEVFHGLGKIPGYCNIELKENAEPVIQYSRKIPFSLHGKLKTTLDSLEGKNVIEKINYPTEWVNNLMIVEKKPSNTLRLCIDPKPLNKYIRREHFTIPTSTDIVSKLTGKSVYSVIDMKDGFWQLVLNKKSSDLCTFNTPFGRYKFNRVPFGICSAPEIFQRKNSEIFGSIENVDVYFDDIIISGKSELDHDLALRKVFQTALDNNIKFNYDKFQYKLEKVSFMGYIISCDGVKPDLKNIEAVSALESPKNRSDVLRILGMVKFFSKFIPNLSAITTNMRNLTRKDVKFVWNPEHECELNHLKFLITNSPTLKIFNPEKDITIQCDASGDGLGCCLLQEGHPVSFASRSLTKSEKRYAQIEKEMLAIVFSFEQFHYFAYGFKVKVQTDHKPLIPIFSKDLNKVSSRLQRMLLKLLKYDIEVVYLPGKEMVIADTLSRSFIKTEVQDDPEMEYVVHSLSNNIPVSEEKKLLFQTEIDRDEILSQIKKFCLSSWPLNEKKLSHELKFYYKLKEKIYLSNNLLFLEYKIIVPKSLRPEMLKLVHEPHFGIVKSKLRARQVFYWPYLNKDIENIVLNCEVCQLNQRSNQKEPLVNHPLPTRPWQYLFSDFFEYDHKNYLLLLDSYSNWVEVTQTKTKTSDDVIAFCKEKFSQFGVPDKFFADNVPYNSKNFQDFAKVWNFELVYSSPHHHQSNGPAERYVGIIKEMLRKANSVKDLHLLIMEYRNTPLTNMEVSPAQLFLNRMLKTKIPISVENLKPKLLDQSVIDKKLKEKQDIQKYYFDRNAKELEKLKKGENILIQKGKSWVRGRVEDIVNDRSYIVRDSNGTELRRNRKFLNKTNLPFHNEYVLYDYDLNIFNEDSLLERNVTGNANLSTPNISENEFDVLYENNNGNMDAPLAINENIESDSNDVPSDSENSVVNENLDDNNAFSENIDVCNKRARKPPAYLKDYDTNFDESF